MDGALIVFNQQTGSVHVLDDLAAWLLLSLDAGLTRDKLTHELVGQGHGEVLLDVAYAAIDKLGENSASQSGFVQEYAHVIASALNFQPDTPDAISFCLLGKVFQLQTNIPGLPDDLHALAWPGRPVSQEVDYQLEIRLENTGYRLGCNGIDLVRIDEYAHILPVLMDHIQIIAYQSSDYLLTLHSAVVSIQGEGVLFPGRSGSGKSTLAVHLMQQGHSCYSDEIAVISSQSLRVIPMPLPVALKSGSWELIRSDYPKLDNLPVWSRKDRRISKYINLPHPAEDLAELPVACIIFPRYDAGQATAQLIPLPPLAALKELTEAGYQVRDMLTEDKIERILSWINDIPAYQLHYSSLAQARQLIGPLMQ